MDTGAEIATTGLSSFVTKAGFPAFAPDGEHVVFTLHEGPGDATTGPGDASQLVSMAFDRANAAFSEPTLLYKADADLAPGWPSFLPTNDAVVFSVQRRYNDSGEFMMTRNGGRGELWWADLATGTAHPLDQRTGRTQAFPICPPVPTGTMTTRP